MSAPKPPRDYLAWAALAAALVVTASAEYALARAAGFGEYTAAALPAALDIYAVRALRAGRDVAAAVVAMIATNAAAHLVEADRLPVSWPLVVGVSAIAPLVVWRVHRLAEHVPAPVPETVEEAELPAPEGVPADRAEAYPSTAPTRTRPVPEAVPEGARLLPIVARPAAVEAVPEPADDQGEDTAPPVPKDADALFPADQAEAYLIGTRPAPEPALAAVPATAPRRRRVTAPVSEKRPALDVPALVERARAEYADRIPSVRELRAAYRIGQTKATAVRDALAATTN